MSKCKYCSREATTSTNHNVKVCQECLNAIRENLTAPIEYYYVVVDKDDKLLTDRVFYNKTQAKYYGDMGHNGDYKVKDVFL